MVRTSSFHALLLLWFFLNFVAGQLSSGLGGSTNMAADPNGWFMVVPTNASVCDDTEFPMMTCAKTALCVKDTSGANTCLFDKDFVDDESALVATRVSAALQGRCHVQWL